MEQDRPYVPGTEEDDTTRIVNKLHEVQLGFERIAENFTQQIEDNRRRIRKLELEIERIYADLRAAGMFAK